MATSDIRSSTVAFKSKPPTPTTVDDIVNFRLQTKHSIRIDVLKRRQFTANRLLPAGSLFASRTAVVFGRIPPPILYLKSAILADSLFSLASGYLDVPSPISSDAPISIRNIMRPVAVKIKGPIAHKDIVDVVIIYGSSSCDWAQDSIESHLVWIICHCDESLCSSNRS